MRSESTENAGDRPPIPIPTLEALHGRLPYGIALFDAGLQLVYANPQWSRFLAQVTGRDGGASPGAVITELLPDAADLHDAVRRTLQTGETVDLPGEPSRPRPASSSRDFSTAPLVEDGRVTGVLCVVTDVTGRVLAERFAAAKMRLAAFRADVSQALASSDDVDTVLQSCAEAMVRHAPAAFARIWVFDEPDDSYRLRASAGLYTRLNGAYARIPAAWIREQYFPSSTPEMALNIQKTHRVREPEWAVAEGLVAWVSHPLMVRGQINGYMVMFGRQNFDPDMLGELATVADAIAQFLERKHAEAIVREREVLFRGVFESAVDGLMLFDPDSGEIFEANPAICRMHGYAEDAFIRLKRADLAHPDARERSRAAIQELRERGQARAQIRHLRSDGSTFYVEMHGSLIPYQGHAAVLAVVRDVTQEQAAHERLEQRVAERTRELSLLLDISRGVASTLDLKPLLELILDHLKTVVDYTGTAIMTRAGDSLVISGQRGPLSDDVARSIRYPVAMLAPVWDRLSSGEAIIIPDVRGDTPEAQGLSGSGGGGRRGTARVYRLLHLGAAAGQGPAHRPDEHHPAGDGCLHPGPDRSRGGDCPPGGGGHRERPSLRAGAGQGGAGRAPAARPRAARFRFPGALRHRARRPHRPHPARSRSGQRRRNRSITCCPWRRPAWPRCGR